MSDLTHHERGRHKTKCYDCDNICDCYFRHKDKFNCHKPGCPSKQGFLLGPYDRVRQSGAMQFRPFSRDGIDSGLAFELPRAMQGSSRITVQRPVWDPNIQGGEVLLLYVLDGKKSSDRILRVLQPTWRRDDSRRDLDTLVEDGKMTIFDALQAGLEREIPYEERLYGRSGSPGPKRPMCSPVLSPVDDIEEVPFMPMEGVSTSSESCSYSPPFLTPPMSEVGRPDFVSFPKPFPALSAEEFFSQTQIPFDFSDSL